MSGTPEFSKLFASLLGSLSVYSGPGVFLVLLAVLWFCFVLSGRGPLGRRDLDALFLSFGFPGFRKVRFSARV